MKNEELKTLSQEDLSLRKRDLQKERFHLRLQKQTGQLEKPSQLRAIRREVARIETLLTQRQGEKA